MVHSIHSVALYGIDGIPVQVEADVRNGFPAFEMLGDLSAQVKEAGGRVRSALYNSGYSMKPQRICINLSPANVRKEGNAFDLPIAVAILASMIPLSMEKLNQTMFAGELGLDGSIRRISGILPMVFAARRAGLTCCVIPEENRKEASVLPELQVIGVSTLQEAVNWLTEEERKEDIEAEILLEREKGSEKGEGLERENSLEKENMLEKESILEKENILEKETILETILENILEKEQKQTKEHRNSGELEVKNSSKIIGKQKMPSFVWDAWEEQEDFAEVAGQESVKRAIEIAASGRHNLLMIGSAGAGKTMLARRIPGILPPMTREEQLELSRLYSVAGLLSAEHCLVEERPFRAPHHSITRAAMAGGGRIPRAGEISLAHRGVLFLDELAEFHAETIEALRQPMEEQQITLSRSYGTVTYPADFFIVAAMNPCRCGYYPDRSRCRCDEASVKRYLNRISGPLLERMDLVASVEPVGWQDITGTDDRTDDMTGTKKGKIKIESSAEIRLRVARAWEMQKERFAGEGIECNSRMNRRQIERYCRLGEQAQKLLREAFVSFGISARVYHKILKIARTIADLDGEEQIEEEHLSEAIHYRAAVKRFWE